MKISQMTTAQASDVLVRIAEPVANIMHDAKTVEVLEKMSSSSEDVAPLTFMADNLQLVVSLLLKDHRADLFEITAALAGKTADEVETQRFTQTVTDIADSFDKELVDFFGSFAKRREKKHTK